MSGASLGAGVDSPKCRVLLIDNYDSYSFNLLHVLGAITQCEPILVQNDDFGGDWDALMGHLQACGLDFHCIVVGPGPGTPEDSRYLGLSEAALRREDVPVPVLGVCLGMQAIAYVYGGRVVRAPRPMHGRLSEVTVGQDSPLFAGIPSPFKVVRYHSLAVDMRGTETDLVVTARASDDGVIMALEHRTRKLFGVQFHPESICAGEPGKKLLINFIHIAQAEKITMPSPQIPPRKQIRILSVPQDGLAQSVVQSRMILKVLKVNRPRANAEETYRHMFQSSDYRAWLDSAMEHPRRGKFSLLCRQNPGTKPLGDRVDFYVDPQHRRMDIAASHEDLRDAGDCTLNIYEQLGGRWELRSRRRGRGCEPFTHMKTRLSEHRPSRVLLSQIEGDESRPLTINFEDLPFEFCCGYIGAMGYGLRKLCGVKQLPDLSVEEPGHSVEEKHDPPIPDLAFFFCDQCVVFDHSSDAAFILTLCDEDDSEQLREQQEWTKEASRFLLCNGSTDTVHGTPQGECGFGPPIQLVPVRSASEYIEDVGKCLENILEGETYEVCLTTQLNAENRSVDPNDLYLNLRRHNPAPFGALVAFGGSFTLCSSSPERYLRVDSKRTVESRPIKGTVRRGATGEEDDAQRELLANSEKDRAENLMIVDLVRNDLGRVCDIGTVSVPDLFVVESFRTVHQLVSTIQGKLKPGMTAIDAARAAFPPGSMTGAPKERTMQVIDSIERCERGMYSGAVGFFSLSGAADLSVVIRTAIVEPNRISVGAGGAVIAMSDPVQERQEMVLKVKALGRCFDILES